MRTLSKFSKRLATPLVAGCAVLFVSGGAFAGPFFFSTGDPNGLMAMASRPATAGEFEIEAADDFVTTGTTFITSASFIGLLPVGATASDIGEVRVEIYRVFPKDSDVLRTSGAPTFSTPQVPTRVNSPSDVAFAERDSAAAGLTLGTAVLQPSFTAGNSIQPGGIHPFPGQTTGGNGAVTGQEVQFNVVFTTPFALPADHYFFIPQVEVTGGEFFWLSAPRPIVPPGTPFPAGFTDLQSWTRDEFLDPDWLRVGTDIVGGTTPPTFNGAFLLNGVLPEPGTALLVGWGFTMLGWRRRKRPA